MCRADWRARRLPVYDRELSLSATRLRATPACWPTSASMARGCPPLQQCGAAQANPDTYNSVVPGQTLTVSDPAKGVIANDINVYGVQVLTAPTHGTLTLNADGTFTYVPDQHWTVQTRSRIAATAQHRASMRYRDSGCGTHRGWTAASRSTITYTSNVATHLKIEPPGILVG